MKYLYLLVLLNIGNIRAQQYISQGRIEYEKKLHSHAFIKGDHEFADARRKATPKFKITYHDLFFRDQTTLYQPGRPNPEPAGEVSAHEEENMVHSLLSQQTYTSEKIILDQRYLIKDSIRKVHWKITSETRTIAGFECRRANAVILDSVYIVAFYSDAITTTGGPESINGLPGMILGLAIPEQHVTWFATHVFPEEIKDQQLKPPAKGKPTTINGLIATLQSILKQWGNYANRIILTAIL